MICEGLVTSVDIHGILNVAPMGPIVEGNFEHLVLRPFQSSRTFSNLSQTRCGVFHVVDSIDVIAKAAIGRLEKNPETDPAVVVSCEVLRDCCHWYEFRVDDVDASDQRSVMRAAIVHTGFRRTFWGFNRARHAVLETAIIATRLHLLSSDNVSRSLELLRPAVEKTGGPTEHEVFAMLCDFISRNSLSGDT